MDFLLECIGFPPTTDLRDLVRRVREQGEPVAWRGPGGEHLRLPLGAGLEVRLDREDDEPHENLWPWFEARRRLRVAVRSLTPIADSPFDVLLTGIANPPLPQEGHLGPSVETGRAPDVAPLVALGEDYPVSVCLGDARKLASVAAELSVGHVLAISLAGFALDVEYVGPNQGVRHPALLDEPCGAALAPLSPLRETEGEDPGGAMEVSLRVRAVRHARNPLTGVEFDIVEADAPGRPIDLFVSRWQLEQEGFDAPRPGWRIEGVFFFSGRVSGGLPKPSPRRGGFG